MNNFLLTQVTEAQDDLDIFLQKNCLGILIHNITKTVVDSWGANTLKKEKVFENHFPIVLDAIKSLLKANSHKRNYIEKEKKEFKKIKKKMKTLKGNSDMAFSKLDLISEFDSFLFQIKSSLDTLARSLNPIYQTKFNAWHKKGEKSGQKILNSLNNLPKDYKKVAKDLICLIEGEIDRITYLVDLRDKATHKGGIKNITGFTYIRKTQKLIKPQIIINNNERRNISEFMIEVMNYISKFTQSFIGFSVMNLMPDMNVSVTEDGEVQWRIVIPSKK